jgi:phage protein D
MKPDFKVTADGSDITAAIRDRLVDLRITDEAGEDSDTLEIKLDDRDGIIELPRTSVELEVWLGYGDEAVGMGLYVVDEISVEFVPAQMRITARAANFSNSDTARNRRTSLRAPQSRDWHQTTLGEIVNKIAEEHGYEARICEKLSAKDIEHVDQVDESDLNLLMRLAKDHDAVAKPAGGRLIFLSRSDIKTADGRQPDTVELTPQDVSGGSLIMPERSKYAAVIAHYHDIELGKEVEVQAGEGTPVFRIRRSYPDSPTARNAAEARLRAFERGKFELNLGMPGNPLLAAGTPIILTGFRSGVDGDYRATHVEHTLDSSGFRTQLRAEA